MKEIKAVEAIEALRQRVKTKGRQLHCCVIVRKGNIVTGIL